jgi:hypothetical protein
VPSHVSRYVVPDFLGLTVNFAHAWVADKELYWSAHLGPLRAGRAPSLYANYRVTRRQPAPGSVLTLGQSTSHRGGAAFEPTPLTLWAVQDTSEPPVFG